jgi:hypothetical protein
LKQVRINYLHDVNTSGVTIPTVQSVTLPTRQFKYVVISGSSLIRLSRVGVNLADYQAVTRFLETQGD